MNFGRTPLAQFFASAGGRIARAVAGIALIGAGIALRDTGAGVPLMVVGVVPLAAGILDVCLLSPLLGGPLSGSAIRACRVPAAPGRRA
ncbi:MAG: DUF2892 domain-containing protein [Bauldia sp.]|nr:DUF2892 domain-containing protein [Bauldia sp.]